ncbi:MAG: hypothetical protein AB7G06_04440 [Bdellovibrionales bacterium]
MFGKHIRTLGIATASVMALNGAAFAQTARSSDPDRMEAATRAVGDSIGQPLQDCRLIPEMDNLIECNVPTATIRLVAGRGNCGADGAQSAAFFNVNAFLNTSSRVIVFGTNSNEATRIHERRHAMQHPPVLRGPVDLTAWEMYREADARVEVIIQAYQRYLSSSDRATALWEEMKRDSGSEMMARILEASLQEDPASLEALQSGGNVNPAILQRMAIAYLFTGNGQHYLHNYFLPVRCRPQAPAGTPDTWTYEARQSYASNLSAFYAQLRTAPLNMTPQALAGGMPYQGVNYLTGAEGPHAIDPLHSSIIAGVIGMPWGDQEGSPETLRIRALTYAGLGRFIGPDGRLTAPELGTVPLQNFSPHLPEATKGAPVTSIPASALP